MKIVFMTSLLFFSILAKADSIFTCFRQDDNAVAELAIKSFTEVEYTTDWDYDGQYEIATIAKGQMWNSFLSTDEMQGNIELQIQGKMFHGKGGELKEITHDNSLPDGLRVQIFKCHPGASKEFYVAK